MLVAKDTDGLFCLLYIASEAGIYRKTRESIEQNKESTRNLIHLSLSIPTGRAMGGNL